MIEIKKLTFNPFQVNTYVVYDSTKECIIVDPGCSSKAELEVLTSFIAENALKPQKIVLTHPHIDHILGVVAVAEHYNLKVYSHEKSLEIISQGGAYAASYGMSSFESFEPDFLLSEGQEIEFGNSKLKIIYVHCHADGSICLYDEEDKQLITGDVLFQGSIGRTDLPTGNYTLLIDGISEKLLTLPDETVVFPGHGGNTTIKEERETNPFF